MAKSKRTTKQLKTRVTYFGDGHEVRERFAVFEGAKRIGTIHKITCDRDTWFDPYRGTKGGDGKLVIKNYIIQRKNTLQAAVNEI